MQNVSPGDDPRPPEPDDRAHTAALAAIASELFGPLWVEPTARMAQIHPRTVARCKAAASDGRANPRALGILHALAQANARATPRLAPYLKPQPPAPREGDSHG